MVELIGFQNVNFTPKDSNDEIKGLSLFVVYPKDHVTGKVAEKVFVSEKKAFGYLPKLGVSSHAPGRGASN
ncbi:MAG: hypothetical protein RR235_09835 [Oscillospiraceae bacterium]